VPFPEQAWGKVVDKSADIYPNTTMKPNNHVQREASLLDADSNPFKNLLTIICNKSVKILLAHCLSTRNMLRLYVTPTKQSVLRYAPLLAAASAAAAARWWLQENCLRACP
jgi:hypothetical protein